VPKPEIRALKQRVSVPSLLQARGLLGGFRRRGHRLLGPCPIHHGDNPSAFVVDLHQGLWFCFTRCNAGGDAIDLVRRLDGVGFREALDILGCTPSFADPALPAWAPSQTSFRPFRRSICLAPDVPFLRHKGIAPATAASFEVGAWGGPGWLQDCIAVRLHDPDGRPLGYAGRLLDTTRAQQCGKWRFPPGMPKCSLLYGFHRLEHGSDIVVTECPWGVLRLAQVGIPAVALLGCCLSEVQRTLLASASHVTLLLDGDPAGRGASTRIHEMLAHLVPVTVARLPDGCDPDDLTDRELVAICR